MQFSGPGQQNAPSNPVANFFRTNFNLCLTIFDTRRGQCEGEEHEKLLSFFPTTAPVHVRTSIVGLAQAVASFATTLTEDDTRFRTMVAEQNKWVMWECEPAIWVLAVVRKAWAGSTCTDAAFKQLLTSVYGVFVLLHGRLSTLLEQDATGFSVRRVLQPLLDEVGHRLLRPEAREHAGLANPLGPHHPEAVPLLSTSHPTFLAVQCLVNQLLISSFFGTRLVHSALVLWGGMPLWSTLGSDDTAALTTLAAKALAPAARAAQQPRPTTLGAAAAGVLGTATGAIGGSLNGGASSSSPFPSLSSSADTAFETLLSPLQWCAGGGILPAAPHSHAAPPASTASPSPAPSTPAAATSTFGAVAAAAAASLAAAGNILLPPSVPASSGSGLFGSPVTSPGAAAASGASPPLPVSSSASAHGGAAASTAAAAAGAGMPLPRFLSSFLRPRLRPSMYGPAGMALPLPHDSVLPIAHVWLRGTQEWAQLLPYHRGQLLVLLLLHDGPPPGPELLAALAAVLGRGAGPAAAALAAEVPGRSSTLWHERGHRYCYTDALCRASRYTPLKKVLTLSSATLRHLAHLRSKMDEWHPQQPQLQQGEEQEEGQVGGPAGAAGNPANGAMDSGGSSGSAQDEQGDPAGPSTSTAAAGAAGGAGGGAAGQLPGPGRSSGSLHAGGDAELVVRTAADAWVVLRAAPGGRRLYSASEAGGAEQGLAGAAAAADVLCDRLFPGVFLPA